MFRARKKKSLPKGFTFFSRNNLFITHIIYDWPHGVAIYRENNTLEDGGGNSMYLYLGAYKKKSNVLDKWLTTFLVF